MEVIKSEIEDVLILIPKKFGDHRGFFSETFNRRALAEAGIDVEFVQDNQSLSVEKGVLRGLHYQLPPRAQDKLVRVVRGAILDVAVDIREGSPTFGKWVAEEISAENWRQIFVPRGFAHGFLTLEPNTEVLYKVTDYYSPEDEAGIRWDDDELAIDWNLAGVEPILSARDEKHPRFSEAKLGFRWSAEAACE